MEPNYKKALMKACECVKHELYALQCELSFVVSRDLSCVTLLFFFIISASIYQHIIDNLNFAFVRKISRRLKLYTH